MLSPPHLSRYDHFVASCIHKHSTFLFEPVVVDTFMLVYRITTIHPYSSPFLRLTLFHQRCSCVLRVLISQRSCTFIFLYVKSTATMLHRLTCKFLAGQCPVPPRLLSSVFLLLSHLVQKRIYSCILSNLFARHPIESSVVWTVVICRLLRLIIAIAWNRFKSSAALAQQPNGIYLHLRRHQLLLSDLSMACCRSSLLSALA